MEIITENEREYLITKIGDLVSDYGYRHTRRALEKIVDTWAENKAGLIEAFKRHPNYVEGQFMIAYNVDYDRPITVEPSESFSQWLIHKSVTIFPEKLPGEINEIRLFEGRPFMPRNLWEFIGRLSCIAEKLVSEETADTINAVVPNIKARAGEKTSRMIGRLCRYLGFDSVEGYNREFAVYADSLSPLSIRRHTALSINPLDYLTMSFGNSWASCHTIDKSNIRDMPNSYEGMYSSGTLSYMLDGTSMVLYTVDASAPENELWNQPKITRQMFHWGEEKLVQGRLYPQSNDDDKSAYEPYRRIVQGIMSLIFDFPNLWSLSHDPDEYVLSRGTHYRDYESFSQCTLSRVRDSVNEECMSVGHTPICIECGNEFCSADCISCCSYPLVICYECGCWLSVNEAHTIDGNYYCSDCAFECSYCGVAYYGEGIEVRDGSCVCEDCREYYYTYCECCETWGLNSDISWLSNLDENVCSECLDEKYDYCDECDGYYHKDDMIMVGDRTLCPDCAANIRENEEEEVA